MGIPIRIHRKEEVGLGSAVCRSEDRVPNRTARHPRKESPSDIHRRLVREADIRLDMGYTSMVVPQAGSTSTHRNSEVRADTADLALDKPMGMVASHRGSHGRVRMGEDRGGRNSNRCRQMLNRSRRDV